MGSIYSCVCIPSGESLVYEDVTPIYPPTITRAVRRSSRQSNDEGEPPYLFYTSSSPSVDTSTSDTEKLSDVDKEFPRSGSEGSKNTVDDSPLLNLTVDTTRDNQRAQPSLRGRISMTRLSDALSVATSKEASDDNSDTICGDEEKQVIEGSVVLKNANIDETRQDDVEPIIINAKRSLSMPLIQTECPSCTLKEYFDEEYYDGGEEVALSIREAFTDSASTQSIHTYASMTSVGDNVDSIRVFRTHSDIGTVSKEYSKLIMEESLKVAVF